MDTELIKLLVSNPSEQHKQKYMLQVCSEVILNLDHNVHIKKGEVIEVLGNKFKNYLVLLNLYCYLFVSSPRENLAADNAKKKKIHV